MRLPDPQRSYAVLIGASTYHFSELRDLPAVRRNLDVLAEMFTDQTIGWLPLERCIVLPDPTDVRLVYRTLRRYAGLAEDTLLVYFAGHGRTGQHNELYLSMTDTDPDELRVSALPFDLIRDVFGDSPAANRVLILDCCFSGRAIQDMSGPDEAILGQIGIEGTYTLTSSPANAVALAPAGADYTAFTGELITLLRTGIPDGPELLTFATIYRHLLHTMTILGLPLPKQRGTGTVDQLALARNPAHHPDQPMVSFSQGAGAFAQAHTATATSHHRRLGQNIQNGLRIQNKKTLYMVTAPLIPLSGAVNFYGLSLLANPVNNWSYVFALIFLLGELATLAVAAGLYRVTFRPFDLRIDTHGIELNVAGRCTSYRWQEIERVTIRRPQGKAAHAIYIIPARGAPPPQKVSWFVSWFEGFPKLEKETGRIFVAPVTGFNIREIKIALTRYAGSRWHPDE